jgi:membrane protease YdiL (CAAX protease family)
VVTERSTVTGDSDLPEPEPALVFPLGALWLAAAGLLGGLVTATFLTLPLFLLASDAEVLAGALAMFGLYVGFGASAWVASKQWGTGRPLADLGVAFRRGDLGWGPLAAVGALATSILVAVAVSPLPELEGSNTEFVTRHAATPLGIVLVLAATIVGAPVFEEVFFRGLVLRALRSRMRAAPAVATQALLFGVVHVQPGQGLGSISVIAATGGIGAVFGLAATLSGRLGPGMVGHALFNGLVVIPLLLGT